MKKYIIILLLLFYFSANSQKRDTVHLSFNLLEKSHKLKKYKDKENVTHFYINDDHFETLTNNPKFKEYKLEDIKNVRILNISQLNILANQIRKELIKKGEKEKKIKILFNYEVFDNLYLYEKISDTLIKRYKVNWIEEIK